MNQVDLGLVVLLALFALRGYWRGFLRESFGLVGLVGGAALAAYGWPSLAAVLIERRLASPVIAGGAAAVLLFVAGVAAAQIAGLVADRLARALFLGGVNRIAGAGLGLAKGATVLGVVLALLARLVPSQDLRRVITESVLGGPLVRVATRVIEIGRAIAPPSGQPI